MQRRRAKQLSRHVPQPARRFNTIAILRLVAMTAYGTKRTWCDVRSESALRGKAEVGFRGRHFG
jgi:hypothetical protein